MSIAFGGKVILGLVVYQGIEAGTLRNLQVEHFDVDKGTIYLPATSRSNARKLTIMSNQLMPLYHYTQKLQKGKMISIGVGDELSRIRKKIKKDHPQVNNIQQLRASRITQWLREKNAREVQYMCGFRYISTVEDYHVVDINKLKMEIQKGHPFGS